MKMYFLDCEAAEQAAFRELLPEHEIHFPCDIEDLPEEAEVVSLFIDSAVTEPILAAHPRLRLVAARSTTTDHIDLVACRRHGVTVTFVPSYGDHTVAEHTFALLLAIARKLRPALESSRNTFSYDALRGFQLRGKTIGVIGAGRIGRHVLRLAAAFGMNPIAYDIDPHPALAEEGGFTYVGLDQLLAESHVISLHAALTPRTYHLLNSETFAKCRRGVVIINTARGGFIDTTALLDALDDGIVSGVGLDVLEDERVMRGQSSGIISRQIVDRLRKQFKPAEPRAQDPQRIRELSELVHNEALLAHPNVVFTPHIGFNSVEALQRIQCITVENIRAFLAGHPINVMSVPDSERSHIVDPSATNLANV
jgi:D-lactate dehydrogenase